MATNWRLDCHRKWSVASYEVERLVIRGAADHILDTNGPLTGGIVQRRGKPIRTRAVRQLDVAGVLPDQSAIGVQHVDVYDMAVRCRGIVGCNCNADVDPGAHVYADRIHVSRNCLNTIWKQRIEMSVAGFECKID